MQSIFNKRIMMVSMVSGVMLAMIEMIYEGVAASGAGFWSAPIFISGTVIRSLQTLAIPVSFMLIPVIIGLMGHMMNSAILGMVHEKLFGGIQSTMARMMVGMLFGAVIFVGMWFVLLPIIDPVMLKLNGTVFFISHLVWGGMLGMMKKRTQ